MNLLDLESHGTTIALLPVCLIGALLNWTVVYSIHNMATFKHAFGFLSANQATADALHSTLFLIYFCPMVLLDVKLMKEYSDFAGFFMTFCYELSILTHFVISLNRFCAVFLPFHYQRIFSETNTKRMILGLWMFTGTVALVCYAYLCRVYYEETTQFFYFTNTEFCGLMAWYGDFVKNAAIVILIVLIDLATVCKVRQISKKIASSTSEDRQHRFSRREMRFLKQTVFQGAVFLLELSTYFFIPKYTQNKWIVFLATSFAWVSVHAADGIVVMICNPEIRKFVVTQGKVTHLEQTSQCSTK